MLGWTAGLIVTTIFGYAFWTAPPDRNPIFRLLDLVFVVCGTGMLLSPLWNFMKARRTVYVLTPKRLAVLEHFPKPTVRSVFPGQIVTLARIQRRDGSGDLKLVLGWVTDSEGLTRQKDETLYEVPNVREVEKLIRQLMERTREATR